MNDHTPLVIPAFRGTYDVGEPEVCPLGFFTDSKNIKFGNGGFETRYGSSLSITISTVVRIAIYKRIGEAQRLLILDSTGKLWDSISLISPILDIAAMTDFSMETIFERAYITPHNGLTGLPGEKVYVYSGSGTARAAAGPAPASVSLTIADAATSGNIEAGERVIAVCYQTDTGFITAPGGFKAHTSAGDKKLDITAGLPVGPSGTSARVVVATKAIVGFDGNFAAQTYYFVPNGTINNNVDTSVADLNFFDADLVDDASYLLEQVSEIPAGVGIVLLGGRALTWGEDADQSIIRVSKPGEPESFNSAEGYATVNPGDAGGGVRNVCGYRGQILAFKGRRSYSMRDNGGEAAFWEVLPVDDSIGTESHGIAQILDYGQNVKDRVVLADRHGLRSFVGTFSLEGELTHSVTDIWERINENYFHKVEVAIDSINEYIYVAIPLDAATNPSHILFGDYSEGLDAEHIKWSLWSFPWTPTTIVVDLVSNLPVLKMGSVSGNIYKIDPGAGYLDNNQAIDSYGELGFIPIEADDAIMHFGGARLRVTGSGVLKVTGKGIDGVDTFTAVTQDSLTLAATPGRPKFIGFNFSSERCSLKIRTNGAGEHFSVTKVSIMLAPSWEVR